MGGQRYPEAVQDQLFITPASPSQECERVEDELIRNLVVPGLRKAI
jgi:hypothetical protein